MNKNKLLQRLTAISFILVSLSLFTPTSFLFATEVFLGKVIDIKDGDTIEILTNRTIRNKIRLGEIDAPEKNQPFGQSSKKSLSQLIFNQEVRVEKMSTDQYGRIVGRVYLKSMNINDEQVRRGQAWVYHRYNKNTSLYQIEHKAKSEKLGLWADKNPTPPWEWRKRNKKVDQNQKISLKGPASLPQILFTCSGKKYCRQMISCEEAKYYLTHCQLQSIDGNNDGIPCENLCKSSK